MIVSGRIRARYRRDAPKSSRSGGGGREREAHAGQLLGALPQAAGDVRVARRGAAADERRVAAALLEAVGADVGVAGDVLARRVQRRPRALLVALRDQLVADPHADALEPAAGVALEVRRRVAGMRRDRADVRAGL